MAKTWLIAGGSPDGVRLALEEAKKGNQVYLLESGAGLTGDIALDEIRSQPNIRLMTNASLEGVQKDGRFKVKIRQHAARVLPEKCDDCRDCLRVCPVNIIDEDSPNARLRTAVDFSSASGGIYSILREEQPVCQETCPAQLDIRAYIALISEGKFAEALTVVREATPFAGVLGYICTHPCEEKCNRGQADAPLAIRSLKRFLADWEMKKGGKPVMPAKLAERKEKVAVIGAGPAGLQCAYDLARRGYPVTVFEALPVPGGMLYAGIPVYRLPRRVIEHEVGIVKALGVDIKLNAPVGKELTLDGLFNQGFSAVFLGVGAHQNQPMGVPGEDAEGVVPGVRFLRDLNIKKESAIGRRVAVVGGGNVAMDSARSAIRLGAEEVSIIYRRTRAEMPANVEEIEGAEQEGVKISYLAAPVEVLHDNGKLKGVRCVRMELGEMDASGRRRPVPVKGSEYEIELDMLVPAIGQRPDLSFLNEQDGIKATRAGTIGADAVTLAAGRAGVFAAGDAVSGPDVAIRAIAAARKAAQSIDRYLRGS